jgi:hypothetical protein
VSTIRAVPRRTIEITADADGTVWVGGATTGCIRGTITL